MVVNRDAHGPGSGKDLPGQLLVALRGFQTSRRMVVGEDEARGVKFERALEDLAGINRRVVDGSFLKMLKGQQVVAVVQEDGGKNLPGAASDLFF